ncbi:MAG: ABC transporter ATP-binding protein [Azospirillaceae bacterium]
MSELTVSDLRGGYSTADSILKGVDLAVRPGRIVAIIGPNGAGKSTLLKAIAGLIRITGGEITVDGASITRSNTRAIVQRGIGFVPQEANVFPTLSVRENLEMGGWLAPRETRHRVEAMFGRFPILAEKRRQAAASLSGGQRQILSMAMAMMTEPGILLLDEPTAGLSPIAATELFDTVVAIRDTGVAVAMVEQNALAALGRSDDAYLLVDGRNAKTGSAAEFLADESVRHMFLGDRAASAPPPGGAESNESQTRRQDDA